ncbi:hypothetical protein D9M72_545020 [compost metagenome]
MILTVFTALSAVTFTRYVPAGRLDISIWPLSALIGLAITCCPIKLNTATSVMFFVYERFSMPFTGFGYALKAVVSKSGVESDTSTAILST